MTGQDGKSYPAQRPPGKTPPEKTPPKSPKPVDLESHLKTVRDLVRECLAFSHTGGEIRAISRELVWCARMLEDRAKALRVLPYNSLTKLPLLITDKPQIVEDSTSPT